MSQEKKVDDLEQKVNKLREFGVPERVARFALTQISSDLNIAAQWIFTQMRGNSNSDERNPPPTTKDGSPLCQKCKNDDPEFVEKTKLITLAKDCKHPMCPDCLSEFLDNEFLGSKKRRGKPFLLVKCPWKRCGEKITYDVFKTCASKKSMAMHDLLLKTIPPVKEPKDQTIYSLKEMGYEFTKDLELRCIIPGLKGKPFQFISERHYNALGKAIEKHIQDVMKTKFKMKEVFLDDAKLSNIFLSQDALTNPTKLMLIIQGSGAVRPGQWARGLCFNDSLHTGSCWNYIEQAQKEGYGVIVLNPNHNTQPLYPESNKVKYNFFDPIKPRRPKNVKRIQNSSSPPLHCIYVWENFVSKAKAKQVAIVAHSAGGWATMELLRKKHKVVLPRLKCVGFTDSIHEVLDEDPLEVRKFISTGATNWATSRLPVNTSIKYPRRSAGCTSLSAGHTVHEHTSESCRKQLFEFFKIYIN